MRIAVHQQCIHFGGRNRSSKVDGSRSLADATLLVGNRDNTSHDYFLRRIAAKNSANAAVKSMPHFGATFHVEHFKSKAVSQSLLFCANVPCGTFSGEKNLNRGMQRSTWNTCGASLREIVPTLEQ